MGDAMHLWAPGVFSLMFWWCYSVIVQLFCIWNSYVSISYDTSLGSIRTGQYLILIIGIECFFLRSWALDAFGPTCDDSLYLHLWVKSCKPTFNLNQIVGCPTVLWELISLHACICRKVLRYDMYTSWFKPIKLALVSGQWVPVIIYFVYHDWSWLSQHRVRQGEIANKPWGYLLQQNLALGLRGAFTLEII